MVAPGDGPKVQDALGYLEEVKQTFSEKTEVYDEFLEIMKEFKSQSLNTDGVITRVKQLFDGHPSLILGFNQFLPEGYEIQLEEPPKPHMEFNQAVTYVAKIKQRFEHNPTIYEEFLDILHEFQDKQKRFDQIGDRAGMDQAILEVKGRVHDLFNGQEDLLQEFSFFLPDNCRTGEQMDMAPDGGGPPGGAGGGGGPPGGDGGAAGGVGAQQRDGGDAQGDATGGHHQQGFGGQHVQQQSAAAGSDEDQYAGAAAANDRRTRRGGYRGSAAQQPMADTHQPAAAAASAAAASAAANDRRGGGGNDMMDTGGSVGGGGRGSGPSGGYTGRPKRPRQPRETPSLSPPRPMSKRLKRRGKSRASHGMPRDSDWELRMFHDMKDLLPSKVYASFLRLLNMYSCDIINRLEMVPLVEDLFSPDYTELADRFKESIGYDEWHREALLTKVSSNFYAYMMSPNFATSKMVTPSYRELPKEVVVPHCSQRTPQMMGLLNDVCVSCPVGTEDSKFQAKVKNPYEDAMCKLEDDRYELDIMIDTNFSVIEHLIPITKRIAELDQDEANSFELHSSEELSVLHLKSIAKMYADHGRDILDLLKSSPATTIPIILKRCQAKDLEWRRWRRDMKKGWQEVARTNHIKARDHRSPLFKQEDSSYIQAEKLIEEFETAADEHGDAKKVDLSAAGPNDYCADGKTLFKGTPQRMPVPGIIKDKDPNRVKYYALQYGFPEPNIGANATTALPKGVVHQYVYEFVSVIAPKECSQSELESFHRFWLHLVWHFFGVRLRTTYTSLQPKMNKKATKVADIVKDFEKKEADIAASVAATQTTPSKAAAGGGNGAKAMDVDSKEAKNEEGVVKPSKREVEDAKADTGGPQAMEDDEPVAASSSSSSSSSSQVPSLEDEIAENPLRGGFTNVVMGRRNWYLIIRYYHLAYSRICHVVELAHKNKNDYKKDATSTEADAKIKSFATILTPILADKMNMALYEDELRSLLGPWAFTAFTIDKVLHSLVQQGVSCCNDFSAAGLFDCFLELRNALETDFDPADRKRVNLLWDVYLHNCYQVLDASDKCYAMEFSPSRGEVGFCLREPLKLGVYPQSAFPKKRLAPRKPAGPAANDEIKIGVARETITPVIASASAAKYAGRRTAKGPYLNRTKALSERKSVVPGRTGTRYSHRTSPKTKREFNQLNHLYFRVLPGSCRITYVPFSRELMAVHLPPTPGLGRAGAQLREKKKQRFYEFKIQKFEQWVRRTHRPDFTLTKQLPPAALQGAAPTSTIPPQLPTRSPPATQAPGLVGLPPAAGAQQMPKQAGFPSPFVPTAATPPQQVIGAANGAMNSPLLPQFMNRAPASTGVPPAVASTASPSAATGGSGPSPMAIVGGPTSGVAPGSAVSPAVSTTSTPPAAGVVPSIGNQPLASIRPPPTPSQATAAIGKASGATSLPPFSNPALSALQPPTAATVAAAANAASLAALPSADIGAPGAMLPSAIAVPAQTTAAADAMQRMMLAAQGASGLPQPVGGVVPSPAAAAAGTPPIGGGATTPPVAAMGAAATTPPISNIRPPPATAGAAAQKPLASFGAAAKLPPKSS